MFDPEFDLTLPKKSERDWTAAQQQMIHRVADSFFKRLTRTRGMSNIACSFMRESLRLDMQVPRGEFMTREEMAAGPEFRLRPDYKAVRMPDMFLLAGIAGDDSRRERKKLEFGLSVSGVAEVRYVLLTMSGLIMCHDLGLPPYRSTPEIPVWQQWLTVTVSVCLVVLPYVWALLDLVGEWV